MSPRVVITASWWGFAGRGNRAAGQVAFVIDDAVPETWAEQISRIGRQLPAKVHVAVLPVPAGVGA